MQTTPLFNAPVAAPAASWPVRLSWGALMLLATGVALYAFGLLVSPGSGAPFIRESPVPWAFQLHFLGGGLALLLGPWQFVTGPRVRRRAWHRATGYAYAVSVLVGIGGGAVLAPYAQTGLVAITGFGALALCTLVSTARAVQLARQHEIDRHRDWMTRSFALILAAVTLRLQLPLSLMNGLAFEVVYPIIAWACWVPNLLIAEWWIRRRR